MQGVSLSPVEQKTLEFVIGAARKWLNAEIVMLFGSRAARTHSERSDFDFAIKPDSACEKNWAFFWSDVDDNAPTLNKLDLVNLNSRLRPEFVSEILRTGKTLWRQLDGEANKGREFGEGCAEP
jgi:predicted nucleotidyltransferase